VRLGSFGEREEKKTERERMINSNCNPTRVNKTLLDPSLTDKREYSNFKKNIRLKFNTVSQTWSKGGGVSIIFEKLERSVISRN
jgi:hypothetical protein